MSRSQSPEVIVGPVAAGIPTIPDVIQVPINIEGEIRLFLSPAGLAKLWLLQGSKYVSYSLCETPVRHLST